MEHPAAVQDIDLHQCDAVVLQDKGRRPRSVHIASAQELGPWMQGRSWSTWSEHAPWIDVDEVLRQSRISWYIERKQIEHPSSAEVVGTGGGHAGNCARCFRYARASPSCFFTGHVCVFDRKSCPHKFTW